MDTLSLRQKVSDIQKKSTPYPEQFRHTSTARVKVFVDWLAENLKPMVAKQA